jgi:hypothetical protein
MKILRRIFPLLLSLVFFVSCAEREGKIIPRGELAEIYAQMFLMDQWINSNPRTRHMADTSLVYEPILNRYGYTSADYRASVDKYMDDPERFSIILRTTVSIFDKKLKELELKRLEQEREEELLRRIEKLAESVRAEVDSALLSISHFHPDSFANDTSYFEKLIKADTVKVDSIKIDLWQSRE